MKRFLISFIELYKYLLSPLLPQACRFVPTCSQYSIDAINTFGPVKGVWLSLQRILKCHPYHAGGFDPVVKKDNL